MFARDGLARYLDEQAVAYEPFDTLSMSLLRFPDPYDFDLSTGRFRAFGTDLANRLVGNELYRAVDGREVRIMARPGGVDVEPLDGVTQPVVEQLLGAAVRPGTVLRLGRTAMPCSHRSSSACAATGRRSRRHPSSR